MPTIDIKTNCEEKITLADYVQKEKYNQDQDSMKVFLQYIGTKADKCLTKESFAREQLGVLHVIHDSLLKRVDEINHMNFFQKLLHKREKESLLFAITILVSLDVRATTRLKTL